MAARLVYLGADLGEGGADLELLPYLSWGHVAAGGHAGDLETLSHLFAHLARLQVMVGAHPSYPDRPHFGRRELGWTPSALARSVAEQLSWLRGLADRFGVPLRSVKPHGALYHRCHRDREAAQAFLHATREVLGSVPVVGLPGSDFLRLAREASFPTYSEGFVDRAYDASGNLRPRRAPSSLLLDPKRAAEQALRLAAGETLPCGFTPPEPIEMLCIHSDTPGSALLARTVWTALKEAGYLGDPASPDSSEAKPAPQVPQ